MSKSRAVDRFPLRNLIAINDHLGPNAHHGKFGWAWEEIDGAHHGGTYVLTQGHTGANIQHNGDNDERFIVARFGPLKADFDLLKDILAWLRDHEEE